MPAKKSKAKRTKSKGIKKKRPYVKNGKTYKRRVGSRAQVFGKLVLQPNGKYRRSAPTAYQTAGGLKKKDLMYRKGRIISKKKHALGKKNKKYLGGYLAKKGDKVPKKGQKKLKRRQSKK